MQFFSLVESSVYDLLAITETGLNASFQDAEIVPPGYQILRCDRTDGRKQGGTCLVAAPRFELRNVLTPDNVNVDDHAFELTCATIHLRNRFLFTCCVVYIPPQTNFEEYMIMFSVIEDICVKYKNNVLVLGDFNLYSANQDVCNYFEYFMSFCEFIQGSSVENFMGRQLDLVLYGSGITGVISVSETEGLQPVDNCHPPLMVCLSATDFEEHATTDNKCSGDQKQWNFSKADFSLLYSSISVIDWSELYTIFDLEVALDYFYCTINNIFNNCVPVKKHRLANSRYSYPQWYSMEVIREIQLKYKLHKKYKASGSKDDYHAFSQCRARVKKAINEAHSTYQERVQNSFLKDPKGFWTFVKNKRGGINKNKLIKDGRFLSESECANELAAYFHSVYNSEPAVLDVAAAASAACAPGGGYAHRVHLNELSLADVRRALTKLKPKRSTGPDGIPPYIVRDCREAFEAPFLHIFNICLNSAVFPNIWKLTRVVPVPKGSGGTKVSDYRPVAVLCTPAKVFESALHHSLYTQVSAQLSDAQHGFRPARSTGSNLLHLMSEVVPAVDSGAQVDVAYLDFRKAFDTVDNDILLMKLAQAGCTPKTLSFFASYMRNRSQFVDWAGQLSEPYLTRSGVSQGSNLGPLKFVLMINDLPDVVWQSTCLLFADDLKLVSIVKDSADCGKLQADIDRVVQWSHRNKLFFNTSKCSVMSFTYSRQPHTYKYNLDGVVLQRVTEVKDLGVHFTSKLNFRDHIHKICKKAYRNLGFVLRQSREFTNLGALRALYEALVKSHLECNGFIWSPHEAKYKLMVERIQNKFIRFLYLKLYGVYPFYPLMYPTLFVLGMVGYNKLEVRRELSLATYMFKLLRGKVYNEAILRTAKLCVPDRYVWRRKRPPLFAVPRARTNLLKEAPLTRVLHTLNKVAQGIDLFCCSLGEFTKVTLYVLCYNS